MAEGIRCLACGVFFTDPAEIVDHVNCKSTFKQSDARKSAWRFAKLANDQAMVALSS